VFAIIHSAESGWASPVTIAALVAGAVLMVVLVAGERRAAQPIMPLRLFADRQRVGAYVARLLYLGAMIGFFYFSTQFMQGVLGFSAFQAGVAFFPMTVVNFAVALQIPRLTARFGQALPLATGVVLTLLGMVWLSRVHVASSYWDAVALPMVLIGAGQGLAFAPLTSAGIAGVPAQDAGAASGLVNTFHQVGMALGLGILVAASANSGRGLSSAAEVLTARVDTALLTGSLLLVLCLLAVLVLVLPRTRRRRSAAAPDTSTSFTESDSHAKADATSYRQRPGGQLRRGGLVRPDLPRRGAVPGPGQRGPLHSWRPHGLARACHGPDPARHRRHRPGRYPRRTGDRDASR
jgi:predicted MFS family arabinose efflux permease